MRNVTHSFRRSVEASRRDEVDLVFLTITHADLVAPIRVVWDTVDYVYNGNTFTGFPFDIQIMSDDEGPPKARLVIQNVDPVIGETIRTLTSPPRLKIELLSSQDFNTTVSPRIALGADPPLNLLMQFEGADASTILLDTGPNYHPVILGGGMQIDTAKAKFGSSSGLFTSGGYFLLDGDADFNFTGDFTVDFWFWFNGSMAGNIQNLYDGRPATNGLIVVKDTGNFIHVEGFITGGGSFTAVVTGQWYHIAVTRSGSSLRLFLNGVQQGLTATTSLTFDVGTNRPAIGTYGNSLGSSLADGWMDELRVIKGYAAWTANFTPPTLPTHPSPTLIYSADELFLINVTVDILSISGEIVGWDFLQRVWPGARATQSKFPGLFR